MAFWQPVRRFAGAGWRGVQQELVKPVREAAAEEAAAAAKKEARTTVLAVGAIITAGLAVFFAGRRDRRRP